MAINVEIWEDAGAIISSRGTIRNEVANIGYKNSALDETFQFYDYINNRPHSGDLYGLSFIKYNYFKLYGSYTEVNTLRIKFNGPLVGAGNGSGVASKIRIFYKWSTNYAVPNNNLLSGTYWDVNNIPTWSPLLSTTGPEGTMNEVFDLSPNTTYYTPYLITQLYMEPSDWEDYGNINPNFEVDCTVIDTISTTPEFNLSHIGWTT